MKKKELKQTIFNINWSIGLLILIWTIYLVILGIKAIIGLF